MVPFVFVADIVVLSVLLYTEGGSTVVCRACELFWPLHVQSGLAFVYLLTVGKFDMFSREEGLLTN